MFVVCYCLSLFCTCNGINESMLWSQNSIGRTKKGVRTSRKDGEVLVCVLNLEGYIGTGWLANPVALHILDRLRPVQLLQVIEQTFCIGCDFQHPLAHRLADNWIAPALRCAVWQNFLISDSRSQLFNPVYWHFSFISQALFVKLGENPLGPLVVVWISGIDFPIPVIGEAKSVDLTLKVGDIFRCKVSWVIACIHSVLLSRQTKGIPTHWVKDIVALRALVAAEDIRRCVAFWVSYVQTSSWWIRKHVQCIKVRLVLVGTCLECMVLSPVFLPLGLDFFVIVSCHNHLLSNDLFCVLDTFLSIIPFSRDFESNRRRRMKKIFAACPWLIFKDR